MNFADGRKSSQKKNTRKANNEAKRRLGDVAENRNFISLSHAMQIPMAEIARHVGGCGSAFVKAIQKMEPAD